MEDDRSVSIFWTDEQKCLQHKSLINVDYGSKAHLDDLGLLFEVRMHVSVALVAPVLARSSIKGMYDNPCMICEKKNR